MRSAGRHCVFARRPRWLAVLLLTVAMLPGARAAHYLAADALDLKSLLPPPAPPDSPVTRGELDSIRQLQAQRTEAIVQRCREIERETVFSFGADVLGPKFAEASLPKTATLFAAVREDFLPLNRAAKAVWPRQRPPFVDARVKPCVEFSDTGAYPSGHAFQAAVWSALLGELLPARQEDFSRRARETMRYKLFSGVHYPSDVEAGRVIGFAVAAAMLRSVALQDDLAAARAELTAAGIR